MGGTCGTYGDKADGIQGFGEKASWKYATFKT
jgi:hypothetical protein